MPAYLTFNMPDNSLWGVPVDIIARDRATHYASEFDGDVEKSFAEDTLPLFEGDPYQIEDWAQNNMNWSDVEKSAKQIGPPSLDYDEFEEAWANAVKEIIEIPEPSATI